MKSLPDVCAVYVRDLNIPWTQVKADKAQVEVIDKDVSDPGGLWLAVAQKWLASNCTYICLLPPGYDNVTGRFKKQIQFMREKGLAASYSNVAHINEDGTEYRWDNYSPFNVNMIGTNVIPVETLLINRQKLINCGGFDYMLAGSYSPLRYLSTMVSCAGEVDWIDEYLVHASQDAIDPFSNETMLSWKTEDSSNMFRRLKLDKWVLRAKQSFKSKRW